MCVRVSYAAAVCCSECLQAAVLSSAGRGRRSAAAERRRREAAACTSEADRPAAPNPALPEPEEGAWQGLSMTEQDILPAEGSAQ